FTHLPEDMELAWLSELQRVTRPGGHLLLTVVGRDYFMSVREKRSAKSLTGRMKRLRMLLNPACMFDPRDRIWDPRAVEHFEQTGFYYLRGSGTTGLPGFYQGSFHTEQYIRKRWGALFDIVDVVGKGIGNCQDLVLCRRRG
ncbi:MAG TPA: hypothetical protein VFP70_09470, partial [Burkholderiales bacterium]|nr:hypothetical protein [Burkholderiales bacterium]